MSTFGGSIEEIPQISVDRFDGDNTNSLIYFLSHCHTDHMRGLEDWAFQDSLFHRPDVFLYASPVSVNILKNMYPVIETKLKQLPMNTPTLIRFPYMNDRYLTVTPLPAGHCPGSVMFLFETEKTVLYTGDYRVNASDLKKYNAFYSLGRLKKIDKLYLDTTFFKLSFLKLPSRKDSLESICKAIKEWIKQSPKHIIKILPSATYGSEFLFIEIAKILDMPVHVSDNAHRFYKCIPEMDKAVTTTYRLTQIHSGCGSHYRSICEMEKNNSLTKTIIPSTLWWENKDFKDGIGFATGATEYRVCYSCHASLEEIEEFLMFLKPVDVEPCVVPNNHNEKKHMMCLLEKVMKMYKEPTEEEEEVKLFDVSAEALASNRTPEKHSSDEIDDLLASPPSKFKRKKLYLNN